MGRTKEILSTGAFSLNPPLKSSPKNTSNEMNKKWLHSSSHDSETDTKYSPEIISIPQKKQSIEQHNKLLTNSQQSTTHETELQLTTPSPLKSFQPSKSDTCSKTQTLESKT